MNTTQIESTQAPPTPTADKDSPARRIGVFGDGWWRGACDALGVECVLLPKPQAVTNGRAADFSQTHAADLSARIACGAAAATAIGDAEVDLLLDNSGEGLAFARGPDMSGLQLAHEKLGTPLVSHFIDPVMTAFQGIGFETAWQALQSATWIKAIWDRNHALELKNFGVPGIVHLPMAVPDRNFNTDPLDPARCRDVVSFVGGQNTAFFAGGISAPTSALFPGVTAHAVQADLPNVSFFDIYYKLYGLGEPVRPEDSPETKVIKITTYFKAKLFYHATLAIRNRDRFVIFLKRHLEEAFDLVGNRWDSSYGLSAAPPLATTDEYFDHFRKVAINLNLVNGNAETGLNMRHFEITAAGGFMLCKEQPELHDCFDVGRECVAFANESDLLEKIRYYLDRPQERCAIALAGQRRTLSQHLYSHRLRSLLGAIQVHRGTARFADTHWMDDLRSIVPDPDVVLDCGANVGQTAQNMRNAYPNAEIYSFEPVADAYEKLQRRCAELNVHPVRKAVGNRDGTATINLTASSEAHSLLGFQEGNPCEKWTRITGTQDVEVCTLDRWCQENGVDSKRVDVVKLDIQGGELMALQGARSILKAAKAVYTEVSFVPIYKDTPLLADIDGFLAERGFRRHALYPSDQPNHWGDALYVRDSKE